MMRFISLLCLLTFCFLTFNAFSQEPNNNDSDQYERLEGVMYNTGNQFIYAFFGKEMLLYYLEDEADIKAVELADENDLEFLASPFNAITGKFFMGGLTIIYILTVAYFILKLAMFGAESTWLMQRRGTTYMDQKEYRAFFMKVVLIGGIAVMPIKISSDMVDDSFYTNAATALFFDMLGYTHQIGDETMGSLILEQKQNLTTITLPAPESKWSQSKEINKFFACTRLDSERENPYAYVADIALYRESDDAVEGFIKAGRCSLSVVFGYDSKSTEKIKIINSQDSTLNLPENIFVAGQKEVFTKVLTETLEISSKKSSVLIFDAVEKNNHPFFESRSTIGDGTGASLRQLENWTADCENVYSFSPDSSRGLTRGDRVVYDRLLSRCLSKDMTEAIVYPDTYAVLNSYMNNRQSVQKELALCVDNSTLTGGSRFVSRYELNSSLTKQRDIEEVAINQCLSRICSAQSVAKGGLYACANSVDLYESRLRDLQIKDRGTLMMGFYMFNLFIYHPPSTSAKAVYNKLSFSFSDDNEQFIASEKTPFVSVKVNIPEQSPDTHLYDEVMEDLAITRSQPDYPLVNLPTEQQGMLESLLPMNRLMTCTKNPLQVVNGFVCGNVPSEFSKFGFDLLDVSVNLKTLLILGNTVSTAKDAITNVGSGIKNSNGGNNKDLLPIHRIQNLATGTAAASAGGAGVMMGMIGMVDNIGFSTRDEFGRLGSSNLDKMLNSAAFMGIIAVSQSNANSMLFKSIDGLLTFLIFIGFFLGFVFPLIPMLFVISAITMFIYLVMKTLLLQGFKLVDAVFDREPDILTDKLDEVFADWISTALKLPMTIIGVVLSWLMSNVIIAHVLSTLDTNVMTNDGSTGYFDFLISILFSFIVIIVIYNMVLTVIESFYDFTVDWVLGQMSNSPFNEDKAINFKDTQNIYSLIGR